MQKNQTKKAALYIRVSTHYQIDKDSLPFQRNELINYAKYALGIDDYAIFEDAGYSGKNTDRPAYQDMMRQIRAKEFSHLCVWKIDRISRNLIDFAAMYEELKKFNCTFVSKNEQFDTSSAIGEAMLRIILVFAELERKLTAERVTSIMYSRANKGLWNGAPIPLGYKWDEQFVLEAPGKRAASAPGPPAPVYRIGFAVPDSVAFLEQRLVLAFPPKQRKMLQPVPSVSHAAFVICGASPPFGLSDPYKLYASAVLFPCQVSGAFLR